MSEPYYDDGQVTLYHGDCREILPSLTADVMVTDPPYGVGLTTFADDFAVAVDGVSASPALLAAIFMSPRRIVEFAQAITWKFERALWWHKTADMAAPWRGWCMNSEAILVFSRPGAAWPKPALYRSDLYQTGPHGKNGHPCSKPLGVVTDLVERLSGPDSIVLDPFMGSGPTVRAAKDLGRRAIGIEIDERYCEIAARRLDQGALDLWGPVPSVSTPT